jgi:hypothetical protein
MSGQPYRYAKDVANFRKDYMDALKLSVDLNDMNLQANKTYKETGALPPPSQMKDNRLTSEILADTEKLKLSIISDLSEVANSQMAQLVIQRVQQSPLNADGSFLIWLAQNAPEFVANLKKKYKFGVAGDSNDAEQMYLFLQTIYTKTKESNSSVKSAFDRPIGNGSGMQPGELDEIEKRYQDIQFRLGSKIAPPGSPTAKLITNISDKLNSLSMLTSTALYDQIKDIYLTGQTYTSSAATSNRTMASLLQMDLNNNGYHEWIEFTDKLPSPAALNVLIGQLEKSEKNQNPELTINILENIYSLLPEEFEIKKIGKMLDDIIATQGNSFKQVPLDTTLQNPLNPTNNAAKNDLRNQAKIPQNAKQLNPTNNAAINDLRNQARIPQIGHPVDIKSVFLPKIVTMLNDVITGIIPSGNIRADDEAFADTIDHGFQLIKEDMEKINPEWETIINYDESKYERVFNKLTFNGDLFQSQARPLITIQELYNELQAIGGAGLKRRRVGRPKGSGLIKPIKERIDKTQGIKQGHTHIQFGKYIINKNKLDDGIFSLKHENGYSVKGHPSTKLNKNLHYVFKTIVGGGQPKYEDLHNLSQEDKTYLHNVSKKAGILDKITIPVPSKDNLEKDIHKFEVMKGEILAGNDSTELIKQFKILLLRLSKNNTIPKREASEIFEDLLTLGY